MTSSIAAYQSRLRALVDKARGKDSLRGLARRMGDENLRTSLTYWRNAELSRPLATESIVALAAVDPYNRNAGELDYWLKTGKELPKIETVSSDMLSLGLSRLLLAS